VGPLLYLRTEPEHASSLSERNDGPRHIGVAALVETDVARLGQAEDLGDIASVDEVVGVDEWRHRREGTSGFGSVRPGA
jgi:hypothetical protein